LTQPFAGDPQRLCWSETQAYKIHSDPYFLTYGYRYAQPILRASTRCSVNEGYDFSLHAANLTHFKTHCASSQAKTAIISAEHKL
jgi:hypothetical protein